MKASIHHIQHYNRLWHTISVSHGTRLLVLSMLCLLAYLPVQAQSAIYRVAYNHETPKDPSMRTGESWDKTMTLEEALDKAKAGDKIWVKGSDFMGDVYTPSTSAGFQVKAGVQLYGGFFGNERSEADRLIQGARYKMAYPSILSGDIAGYKRTAEGILPETCPQRDALDVISLIYPGNTTRNDNAQHVVAINMASNGSVSETRLDGFVIRSGHATNAYGGGVYVYGENKGNNIYTIARCFIHDNYAKDGGGGIYVAPDVKDNSGNSKIIHCMIANNAAGERVREYNVGSGIYLGGGGVVVNTVVNNNESGGIMLSPGCKVINSNIVRNAGGGIEMTAPTVGNNEVMNSVLWGNFNVKSQNQPTMDKTLCDCPLTGKATPTLDENNRGGANSPVFSFPSTVRGYDTTFDFYARTYPRWEWGIYDGSALIDAGDVHYFDINKYGDRDLVDRLRTSDDGSSIDVGAQQFRRMPAGRIRYVTTTGAGKKDGTSWGNASNDIQKMIDELAIGEGVGEVWVAEGTYTPRGWIDNNKNYTASFQMRDGISVYGGFAGTETDKNARAMKAGADKPWEMAHRTILEGAEYGHDLSWNANTSAWTLTGTSRHVVWMAPYPSTAEDFENLTVLDGVTIQGGFAQGGSGMNDFHSDVGAGVFMGARTMLTNSVVRNCVAAAHAGGVYMHGGYILGTLVYNCGATGNGGGVYMSNDGQVRRCIITNCASTNGSGVYMHMEPLSVSNVDVSEQLVLSTSVVSHNTNKQNGAVYCDYGGVVIQTQIVKNRSLQANDQSDPNSTQTGGLYIQGFGKIINSILWNNEMPSGNEIQMYARNADIDRVKFYNVGVSHRDMAVWNHILQKDLVDLSVQNAVADEGTLPPNFEVTSISGDVDKRVAGIDVDMCTLPDGADPAIYDWKVAQGSELRALGLELGRMTNAMKSLPELDIVGEPFQKKPSLGAYSIKGTEIKPETTTTYCRVYVDPNNDKIEQDGSSWEKAYGSLNDAIDYLATVDNALPKEIYVKQGTTVPAYSLTGMDPRTATLEIRPMLQGSTLTIKAGWSNDPMPVCDPIKYRTTISGNDDSNRLEDGLYHCIVVMPNAKVVIDGMHVINGYAAGSANRQTGAGLLAYAGSQVTLRNCIFENNTAAICAAIDAEGDLTMTNCVVNNNTNLKEDEPVLRGTKSCTLQYVTIANNLGAAPTNLGATGATSLAVGNSAYNYPTTLPATFSSVGKDGAFNFANPTNKVGATMGFNTYLGGYSEFRPLTSSQYEGIINKAAVIGTIEKDIAGQERNLGGAPDLGAYEAELPANGSVLYVTQDGAGKKDGSSWDNAIAGNMIYDVTKEVNQNPNLNILTTDQRYVGFYDASARPYGETSGASHPFHNGAGNFDTTMVSNGTEERVNEIKYEIKNNRNEKYVSGLQYAVEQASKNAGENNYQVWVAGGIYNDYKGFVIRDKVDVYGGFPNVGTPGMVDRNPLKSQYTPNKDNDAEVKYETILQIQNKSPFDADANLPRNIRKPVLFQPDVCLPTKAPYETKAINYEAYNWETTGILWWEKEDWVKYNKTIKGISGSETNDYRYKSDPTYVEYRGALWDGFTIRHGFIRDYMANRDGGGGVRMFRGVTLQNCVVTDNWVYAQRNRGGGIYCDGDNSKVVNCFILNNKVTYSTEGGGSDPYGGGMYMIVGTGYNNLVAKNTASLQGGGIFIEDANFYNNTVVDNYCEWGGTGGLHQYTDGGAGRTSSLVLYNCILYRNQNYDLGISPDVTVGNYKGAHSCFIETFNGKANEQGYQDKNSDILRTNGANLFASDAKDNNNYRLTSTAICINAGTDNLGNDAFGKKIVLPSTDVEFTARIKDCTVDIGAYERRNTENVKPDANGFYYVTPGGAGNACADSPANAACEEKLQEVLNVAGNNAAKGETAIVRIAVNEDAASSYTYHTNTLSNPNDPQSYSYVIPEGVTLEGGWNNSFTKRRPEVYRTMLSPLKQSSEKVEQNVNGYHTILFKAANNLLEKEEDFVQLGMQSLTKPTIVDGVYLIEGKATSFAGRGNKNAYGGGAIVPEGAHVRNCVVTRCEALDGGALYVMPGGMVSGTVVRNNRAERGAGVFATPVAAAEGAKLHSYMLSCTITDNVADHEGGGVFLDGESMMTLNSIIWGNKAEADKNVSGVVAVEYKDVRITEMAGYTPGNQPSPGYDLQDFYPFNNCFIESYEMPSNIENNTMNSDASIYFADDERHLKDYSAMVKHGLNAVYYQYWIDNHGVAAKDRQEVINNQPATRCQEGYEVVDVGAYAYPGGQLQPGDIENVDDLITRLFVSMGTNVQQTPENFIQDKGRTFFTAFNYLQEALDYIATVRNKEIIVNGQKQKLATDATHFDIYVARGTYKPSKRRADAQTIGIEQTQNSYVIPANVSIYGGFSGAEKYSCGRTEIVKKDNTKITGIKDLTEANEADFLNSREYSDLNGNGFLEPWEMGNQTILSGLLSSDLQTTRNVYHVVFSKGSNGGNDKVTLDGLTIMHGETANRLQDNSELGRGAALYTEGMNYDLSRCRLIENKAVRGGAVFAKGATVQMAGCMLANNGSVKDPLCSDGTSSEDCAQGGAVYIESVTPDKPAALHVVNSLWANNQTVGWGGTFATHGNATVNLMNNTFVCNKAKQHGAGYLNSKNNVIINTTFWGNEEGEGAVGTLGQASTATATIQYSAADWEAWTVTKDNHNVRLNRENNAVDGPRFKYPSDVAGNTDEYMGAWWNPGAISVMADVGNGCNVLEATTAYPTLGEDTASLYYNWFEGKPASFRDIYIQTYATGREHYPRYQGSAYDDSKGTPVKRTVNFIDIGFYEYRHSMKMSGFAKVYVTPTSRGDGSGRTWNNATSDMKGAIMAMAMADTDVEFGEDRKVYILGGEYAPVRLSHGGVAYPLYVSETSEKDGITSYSKSVEIVGACTGATDANGVELQDFSHPSVVKPLGRDLEQTNVLISLSTNVKPVTISGLVLANQNPTPEAGVGLEIKNVGAGGKVTLKNMAFRANHLFGVGTDANAGEVLYANCLFADGEGVGLQTNGITKVVNCTFAQNVGKDIRTVKGGTTDVYNSVAWSPNKGKDEKNFPSKNMNRTFPVNTPNKSIKTGPNFVDPDHADVLQRNYRIRPSVMLYEKGSTPFYERVAMGIDTDQPDYDKTLIDEETDLFGRRRKIGKTVDIGAYEYDGVLQPIIYVDTKNVGDQSGKDWDNPANDLQGAVDLAALYYHNHFEDKAPLKNFGYVMVHGNYTGTATKPLTISMPGVKVYGSMNDELSTHILGDNPTEPQVLEVVADLLTQRKGFLEAQKRTVLGGLNLSAENVVVDGFELNGDAHVEQGCLSTSLVHGAVNGVTTGVLYNSLVLPEQPDAISVQGVQAVNVTTLGSMAESSDVANNIVGNGQYETNRYVTEGYWKYQLNETSLHIDNQIGLSKRSEDLTPWMTLVGHQRDLAGNKRMRTDKVDNGCFETWNVAQPGIQITTVDKPVGHSVVYVREEGKELGIAPGEPMIYPIAEEAFRPGFLLLEHGAGLRGNGNYVELKNFATERRIPAGEVAMVAMPFDVDAGRIAGMEQVEIWNYSGALRAEYHFKFDAENGAAWTQDEIDHVGISDGLMLKNTGADEALLRFYNVPTNLHEGIYKEGGTPKTLTLQKYNYVEPWSDAKDETSKRFTYKENMSWNFFGSPYLCAMNYSDLEYGRVIYAYEDNAYKPIVTWTEQADETQAVEGHIPMGCAVFTQSATLKDEGETFEVSIPTGSGPVGGAFAVVPTNLPISLRSLSATRAAASDESADLMRLHVVDEADAKHDFDMAADGVKWMTSGKTPQLYAMRNGGRYALLSGVSEVQALNVGVALPTADTYAFAVPDDYDADAYEAVVLHDLAEKTKVNLLDEDYVFHSDAVGDVEGRFVLEFRLRKSAEEDQVKIWSDLRGCISLAGLQPGDVVYATTTMGQRITQQTATAEAMQLPVNMTEGVAIVTVTRAGERVASRKVLVR